MQNRQSSVTYEVVTHIGTLAQYPTGWTKELNIISWNGGNAKFDIRDWSEDHKQLSKGVTLHKEEARELMELLQARFQGVDAEPRTSGNRGRVNSSHNNGSFEENNQRHKDTEETSVDSMAEAQADSSVFDAVQETDDSSEAVVAEMQETANEEMPAF